MSNSTMVSIIIGSFGFFIYALWKIAEWTVGRFIREFDGLKGVVGGLTTSVDKLTTTVAAVQSKQKADDEEKLRHQHYMHEEIEMLRDSRHVLFRYLQSVRSVLESTFRSGDYKIEFREKWALPTMKRDRTFPFPNSDDDDDGSSSPPPTPIR